MRADTWTIAYLAIGSFGFVVSAIMLVADMKEALWLTVISEFALIAKLDNLKRSLVISEYGDPKQSAAPDAGNSRRDTRYLMFKRALQENHITRSHVSECFDLLAVQIELSGTSDHSKNKIITFSIGLISGVLAALWKTQSSSTLLFTIIAILVFAFFTYLILSIFPSKLEKLREMKYFMYLYCREIGHP